jgi:hypothetical protein
MNEGVKNMKKLLKYDVENAIKIVLIILTFVNLIWVLIHFTYNIYDDGNISYINNFLLKINDILLIMDIAMYIVTIVYIVAAIKSKKELLLKLSLALFSLLTNMISITLIVNLFSIIFKMN